MNRFIVLKLISTLFLFFLAGSCTSVKNYNLQVTKLHSPEELHRDTDLAYEKLQKLHPDLYWYISKEALDKKFKNLKDQLQTPLTSREYYIQLAPVITAIKQGHTSVYPPVKKKTKTERKAKKKEEPPFKPFRFKRIKNKLYITKNFGKDSTLFVGSELLSVANEKVDNLLTSFEKLATSDGFNKTFLPQYIGSHFGEFYTHTHIKKDSISLILKNKDSIYSHFLIRKKSIALKKDKDTLKQKLSRKKKKSRKKWESKYGYNKYTKEKTRDLNFISLDASHIISYIKIRGFHEGNYEDFYKESFAKIDSAKSNYLILDLRGNLGGRLSEINELYSYLSDKEYLFIKEAKMTKGNSFMYPFLHSKSWLTKSFSILLYPALVTIQAFKVKKIDQKPNFQFRSLKRKQPKSNNYKGNVYVLINGESFSASAILSTHLKATKRAVFVGEETGGSYNSTVAGMFANIELPNSKVRLRIGLMNLKTPYTTEPDGYGIKPDVLIKTTRLDKDEQLVWILSDILKN